jgi:protein-tyrosine-phosphatase
MAEGILRKKIKDRNLSIEVDSAGTANYHVGQCPDDFLVEGNKGLDVPDPWFGEPEGFFPVHELIDKTCDKILDEITKGSTKAYVQSIKCII